MTGAKQGIAEQESVTLDLLKRKMDDFAKERDWEKFHSPRNLLLALVTLSISLLFVCLFVCLWEDLICSKKKPACGLFQ